MVAVLVLQSFNFTKITLSSNNFFTNRLKVYTKPVKTVQQYREALIFQRHYVMKLFNQSVVYTMNRSTTKFLSDCKKIGQKRKFRNLPRVKQNCI